MGYSTPYLAGPICQGQSWLIFPTSTRFVFVFINLWSVGGQMVIFLAGLQGVPDSLLEAADIDGAGKMLKFWHITRPMLSSTIFFNLVIGVIASFQVFTQAYVMTNGGPQNATEFLVLYIYATAFQSFQMGYAATLAWLLFLVIGLFYDHSIWPGQVAGSTTKHRAQ